MYTSAVLSIQDLGFIGNCHRNTDTQGVRHMVKSPKGSILEQLYGEEYPTNSFHHQAIKEPAPGFFASAICEDNGIIEAIQHETKPIMGVQWHPERMCLVHKREDLSNGLEIFKWFVEKCRE